MQNKVVEVKADVETQPAYRCSDCGHVFAGIEICMLCGSLNKKDIKIHTVKPAPVVSELDNTKVRNHGEI